MEQKSEKLQEEAPAAQPAVPTWQWVNHNGVLVPTLTAQLKKLTTTTTHKVVQTQPILTQTGSLVHAPGVVTTQVVNSPVVTSQVVQTNGHLVNSVVQTNGHLVNGLVNQHVVSQPLWNTYPAYNNGWNAWGVHQPLVSAPLTAAYASPTWGYYGYPVNSALSYNNYIQLLKKKK